MFALLKKIADARRTHAHEHFHELTPIDRKERHLRFACNGACQQRFLSSRRSDQQESFWHFRAQRLVTLGVLQEHDHLLQLVFCFLAAGYVVESDLDILISYKFGAAASKNAALTGPRLAFVEQKTATAKGLARSARSKAKPVR